MDQASRPWAGTSSRYGILGENAEWKLALEEFHWDRLENAHRAAQSLGSGVGAYGLSLYRMIEAEYVTRLASETRQVNEWLSVESIAEEVEDRAALEREVLEACNEVGRRLGWNHGAPTLVSVLAQETDAPWTLGRFGYMVDKYPMDKICIPLASLASEESLRNVVMHEYAHVATLNIAQGRAPRWLDEAIAMSLDQTDVDQATRQFTAGAAWLRPAELEKAFALRQNDPSQQHGLWLAYMQSAAIGGFLVRQHGAASLAGLLQGFANNSHWTELKMTVKSQPPEDEALKEVFGYGVEELFRKSSPKG